MERIEAARLAAKRLRDRLRALDDTPLRHSWSSVGAVISYLRTNTARAVITGVGMVGNPPTPAVSWPIEWDRLRPQAWR
jgi:hypothetical protein